MSDNSFSLVIGEKYLRVMDCEANKNNITVRAAAYDEYQSNIFAENSKIDINISNKVLKLISDAGINKKQVNIVIPDSYSYSRIIDMPMLSDKELISAIKYQADQFIPISIDNLDLDAVTLFKDKSKARQYILIVACLKSTVDKMAKIAEMANLIPISVENESSSTTRFFKYMFTLAKNKNRHVILINFGITSTTILFYDIANNFPLHIYNFNLGLGIFEKDLKANYALDDNKISQVLQTVGFESNDPNFKLESILSSPVSIISEEINKFNQNIKDKLLTSPQIGFMYGEGNIIKNLNKELSKKTNIQIEILDPNLVINQNTVSNFFKNDWPIFISAMGGLIE